MKGLSVLEFTGFRHDGFHHRNTSAQAVDASRQLIVKFDHMMRAIRRSAVETQKRAMVEVVLMALFLVVRGEREGERCSVPLVVFGASMMDEGLDYFKAPTARYSNGRVISDFICWFKYLPTPMRLSRAIHVIMHGHNDYDNTIRGDSYDPLTTVTSVIAAFEYSLRELYSVGARTMIVINVLPLGCTPTYLTVGETTSKALDEDSCVAEFNSLVDLHNSHLQRLINQMREALAWNELVIFDLNAVYIDAVRHPSKYGVKYPMQACCGVGGKYNISKIQCGSKGILNGKEVQAGRCASPTEYISWDGFHPTESFAKHIASALLSGKYFSPSMSIRDVCE